MATKKKAAKPSPKKKAPARKKQKCDALEYLKKLVHAPNSSKGTIDEVEAYLQDKSLKDEKLNFVRHICHQAETNTEKVQLLIAYLQTV